MLGKDTINQFIEAAQFYSCSVCIWCKLSVDSKLQWQGNIRNAYSGIATEIASSRRPVRARDVFLTNWTRYNWEGNVLPGQSDRERLEKSNRYMCAKLSQNNGDYSTHWKSYNNKTFSMKPLIWARLSFPSDVLKVNRENIWGHFVPYRSCQSEYNFSTVKGIRRFIFSSPDYGRAYQVGHCFYWCGGS